LRQILPEHRADAELAGSASPILNVLAISRQAVAIRAGKGDAFAPPAEGSAGPSRPPRALAPILLSAFCPPRQ